MENNEIGKWLHPVFAGTSMAYFFTVLDKPELIASSKLLTFSTLFFALSLALNSIWSYIYYVSGNTADVQKKLRSNCIGKGFDNLCFWSFIFPLVSLVSYILWPLLCS